MSQDRKSFVSYSDRDAAFALRLAVDLAQRGVPLWMDRLNLLPGEDFRAAAAAALDAPLAFLAVISPAYLESGYCRAELDRALSLGVPICVALLQPVPEADLPVPLAEGAYGDFRAWPDDGEGYWQGVNTLVDLFYREAGVPVAPEAGSEARYLLGVIRDLGARLAIPQIEDAGDQRPDPDGAFNWLAQGCFGVFDPRDMSPALPQFRPHIARYEGLQSVAEQYPRFVLIGDGGSGKTTLLSGLALQAARARLAWPASAPLPLILPLAAWSGDVALPSFIRQAAEAAGWPSDSDPLAALSQGEAALYLDGLSETEDAVEKAERLREWLQSDAAPQRLIVTCDREAYLRGLVLGLPAVQIIPWDAARAEAYLAAAVNADFAPEPGDALPAGRAPIHPSAGLRDLLRHPLLLNVLARAGQPAGGPEGSAGMLLRRLTEHRWAEAEGRATVSWTTLEAGLAELAFQATLDAMPVYLPEDYAVRYLGDAALLDPANSGAFLEMAGGAVRFVHQAVRDYFAARYIVQAGALCDYLALPQFDPGEQRIPGQWDAAVILLSGLAPDPEAIVYEVARVDPFLAFECAYSGLDLSRDSLDRLAHHLLSSSFVHRQIGRVAAVRLIPADLAESAMPTLLETMRNGAWDARWAAADTLFEMNPPLLPGVLEALADLDSPLNTAAGAALRKIGQAALPTLLMLMYADDAAIRRGAARALGQFGDPAAVPVLVEALQDADPAVVIEAAGALGWIRDSAATLWLPRLLHHDHPDIRQAAIRALGWMRAAAVDSMLDAAVNAPDLETRTQVIEALKDTSDRAVQDRLLHATTSDDGEIRAAALEALENAEGPVFVKRLIDALEDTAYSRWRGKSIGSIAAEVLKARGYDAAALAAEGEEDAPTAPAAEEAEHIPPRFETEAPAGRNSASTARSRLKRITAQDAALAAAPAASLEEVQEGTPAPLPTEVAPLDTPPRPASRQFELADDLTSLDWSRRSDAVLALQGQEPEIAIPRLIQALKDEDSQVRLAAVDVLQTFNTEDALRGLFMALGNDEYLVCDAASDAFARIGRRTVPYLIRALSSPQVNMRAGAVEALGKIADPAAMADLTRLLSDTERPWLFDLCVGDLAAKALESIGTREALQIVLQWRAENAPDPRTQALSQAPVLSEDLAAPAESAAEDDAPSAPEAGASAPATATVLPGELTPPRGMPEDPGNRQIVLEVLDNLRHPEWEVRQAAARTLREYAKALKGADDPTILGRLQDALEDPSWEVRWAVVEALAWIANPVTVPAIARRLEDKNWIVRVAAIRALTEIRDISAAPAVIGALKDRKGLVREAAAEALGELGVPAAVNPLIELLQDSETLVRLAAIYALGRLRARAAVRQVMTALRDEDANIRLAAAVALGKIGDPLAISRLIEALEDTGSPSWEEQRVCDAAAGALEDIGTPEALDAATQWRSAQAPGVAN